MDNVLEYMRARKIGKVLSVRLAIGELACVEPEQLKFCFESITQETLLEGSTLEMEEAPARVKCQRCAYEGPPKYWMDSLAVAPVPTLQCPQCGKAAEATQGHECAIKTIQYVA